MKTKKIDKKLLLNKKTVANLTMKAMNPVKGGFTGHELCTRHPIFCDTALCPAQTAEC
jgi:hypothetical protein